jgi:RNA polymerase sigma-70 factor, ECF subfamily
VDEKQAIARLIRGDLVGLEMLVDQYQLKAVRTACLITGDRYQAEEIVQTSFIRAAERIKQFDPQRPFGPWFLRSVINEALKTANRQKRFISLESDRPDEGQDTPERIFEPLDPAPLPEKFVESKEVRNAIREALGKLPPNQRAAIVMRYYLDLSEEQMAEKLSSPIGTIKWWLHAARQRLKKLLQSIQVVEDLPTKKCLRREDCPEASQDAGETV